MQFWWSFYIGRSGGFGFPDHFFMNRYICYLPKHVSLADGFVWGAEGFDLPADAFVVAGSGIVACAEAFVCVAKGFAIAADRFDLPANHFVDKETSIITLADESVIVENASNIPGNGFVNAAKAFDWLANGFDGRSRGLRQR